MPAAVPAIPPKPKIAAIMAITKKINAHPNMIHTSAGPRALSIGSLPTPFSDLS